MSTPATIVADQPAPLDIGPSVVALDQVFRSFGANPALAGLSFTVPAETITVLLGPNGAGKTTCTRVITGALGVDAGSVQVFGSDPTVDGAEIRRRIGIVSAKPALYDRLTGEDNLRYAAELYGLGRGELARQRILSAAEHFGIVGALRQQVGGYSTGMKTRLALARSVLHGPDLLLYDEPTSGLDPESSHAVLELIRQMTSEGNTVIMCTHLLLEAEGLADQVVMLQGGQSLVQGPPAELVRRYWPDDTVFVETEDPAQALALDGCAAVRSVEPTERGVVAVVDDLDAIPDLVFHLAGAGIRVRRIEAERHSLEDLYFAVRRTSGDNRIGEVH